MKNPFFEEYLIGLCQGLLADGELTPTKVIYFRKIVLLEHSFAGELFDLDDFSRKIYEFVKRLPEWESDLTDEMCDAMLYLCMKLLARKELQIVDDSNWRLEDWVRETFSG